MDNQKINAKQEQIHEILFNREIGWKEIIYDLINTEQLDPWDVNITILAEKYLEKIREYEETDFFVSSKVLLAAALLLKIKSEMLLNKYMKSVDEILFGKTEKKSTPLQRIELDEEIPELIPKSPLPRFRKVTLKELIESLNKAITTENRRIKKEILKKNALRETSFSMPKKTYSIKDKIREIHFRVMHHLKKSDLRKKISFTELIGEGKNERVISFFPLLHLENQQKIWLEQETHFEEIYVWLRDIYFKHNPDPFAELKEEIEEELEELGKKQKKRLKKIEEEFKNPLE